VIHVSAYSAEGELRCANCGRRVACACQDHSGYDAIVCPGCWLRLMRSGAIGKVNLPVVEEGQEEVEFIATLIQSGWWEALEQIFGTDPEGN
jgi:DNA-directed RNA polymerase subunit RPC12/RpoP